jgi:hypothetical protein
LSDKGEMRREGEGGEDTYKSELHPADKLFYIFKRRA